MKVYFACSIAGGRDSAHLYQDIVDAIKDSAADLLSELFADPSINSDEGIAAKHGMGKSDVWKWDLDWVREADLVIAEVTQPSLGVGYEIAKAEEWDKPILCLFHESSGKRLSAMIEGSIQNTTKYYSNSSEVKEIVRKFIKAHQ